MYMKMSFTVSTPPHTSEVRLAELELVHGHRHRAERRRARRVGHAVRAAEVEAVRDPARDDVSEETREGCFLPRRVVRGDALADRLDLVLGQPRLTERLHPHRALETRDHAREELLRRRDAEDHAHAIAIHVLELTARRVLEYALRDDEREQLRGVGRREDARWDPPRQRVEVDVAEERSALGVRLVRDLVIGVVVVVDQPVRRRHVADEVAPFQDVAPEAGRVERAREQGAHRRWRSANGAMGLTHDTPLPRRAGSDDSPV